MPAVHWMSEINDDHWRIVNFVSSMRFQPLQASTYRARHYGKLDDLPREPLDHSDWTRLIEERARLLERTS